MAFNRQLNLNNIDQNRGNTPQPIPPGEYRVRIAAASETISQASGKDMIKLELDILDAPYDKRKLWYYITDDQYADQKVAEIFWSAGKNLPPSIHPQFFPGLVCKVKTRSREYNGEQRAEVHYFIKPAVDNTPAVTAPATAEPPKEDGIPF
jgi:hypothetical protein